MLYKCLKFGVYKCRQEANRKYDNNIIPLLVDESDRVYFRDVVEAIFGLAIEMKQMQ